MFYDRGLREPITIGHVVAEMTTRTLRGEELVRRGFQHQL
jgi:hypothetical protein